MGTFVARVGRVGAVDGDLVDEARVEGLLEEGERVEGEIVDV